MSCVRTARDDGPHQCPDLGLHSRQNCEQCVSVVCRPPGCGTLSRQPDRPRCPLFTMSGPSSFRPAQIPAGTLARPFLHGRLA